MTQPLHAPAGWGTLDLSRTAVADAADAICALRDPTGPYTVPAQLAGTVMTARGGV